MFFVWYDDTPKKPVVDKIQEGIAVYVQRFKTRPTLVLVNAIDLMEMPEVMVRCDRTVQPNTFWLGREEGGDIPTA